MNVLIIPLCIWLAGGIFCCKAAAEIITARSSSGQFVAREIQFSTFPGYAPKAIQTRMADGWGFLLAAQKNPSDTDESSMELEPSLLVVTCERLKEMFLTDLGLQDQWKGNVALMINPALDKETRPQLMASYTPEGWSYNLALPKTISTRLLVRALMDTLLLEMANRNAGSQCAEIPFWLVEGMSAHVQCFNLPTFLLQPGEQMAGNRVKLAGLDKVRDQLRRHSPLSFQELSWPAKADADGDGSELYRSCAQLFVEQLLQFKDGNRLLGEMLRELATYHNWQTAFLSAFRPHFRQLLDVEKWWGLSYIDFTRTDAAVPLTAEVCLKDLQDALDVPAQVHFETGHMPAEAKFTLQEVIGKWDPADATLALDRSIETLRFLRGRASPQFRPLMSQYLKVLTGYLNSSRDPRLEWALGNHHPAVLNILKSDTVAQLDMLDRQRSALQLHTSDSIKLRQLSVLGDSK